MNSEHFLSYQSRVAFQNRPGHCKGWAWGQGSPGEAAGPWDKWVEGWAGPDEDHHQAWTSPGRRNKHTHRVINNHIHTCKHITFLFSLSLSLSLSHQIVHWSRPHISILGVIYYNNQGTSTCTQITCQSIYPVNFIILGLEAQLGRDEGALEERGLLWQDPSHLDSRIKGEANGVTKLEQLGAGGENTTKLLDLLGGREIIIIT